MLLDYVIIKLSESKTTMGAFTSHNHRGGGEGVSKMLMHDYGGGWGWPCDDTSK